jgi:hypothetical protein
VRCGYSDTSAECLTGCNDIWATGGACRTALDTYSQCIRANSSDCNADLGVCSASANAFIDACAQCPWTNDGECDEPNLCPVGTDVNDCACVEGSAGNTCQWACDAECDEPDLCEAGTDTGDCG